MSTRRDFVKLAGAGALASTLSINSRGAVKKDGSFSIGIAGYTFNPYKNNFDKLLEVMKAINVQSMTLKDFYLPYDSSQQQADEIMNKIKSAGLNVYGLGVINLKAESDVSMAFEYAKRAGVKMILVSPKNYDFVPLLEKKAKEYQIKAVIHNHGPEDKLFPDIDSIYERIKNMDPLVGICLDIGHSFRCKHDPGAMLLKYKDRVYDMHIKDVEGQFADAKGMTMGHGKIDLKTIVKAIKKSGYSASCSIEYEVKQDPVDFAYGIAESVGYFRGIINSLA